MLGKTLTVIDGAVLDERQNKAVKDMIRNHYVELYSSLAIDAFGEMDEEQIAKDIEKAEKEGTLMQVTLEEAAGA